MLEAKRLKIRRLSHTLRMGDARFPGNPDVQIERKHSFEKGDCCNTFQVQFFNHNGTHIDFPNHYVAEGRALGDYLPEEFYFDFPVVIDIPKTKGEPILERDLLNLQSRLEGADAVLLRTGYQKHRGDEDFSKGPYLTREAAAMLRLKFQNIKCWGLDTLSITSLCAFDEGQDVHRILLGGSGAPFFIEDMNLGEIKSDEKIKRLIIAPWFVEGVDGGPCTVFGEFLQEKV